MWGWQFGHRRFEESGRGDGRQTDIEETVLTSCDSPAYMHGLGTMALSKKQQGKVQVCENNWIRRIVGVKKADKRRTDELRVEVGVKDSFKKTLVRSALKWAGHMERMRDEKLTRTDA